MKKLYCNMGSIGRTLTLRFSVTLKSGKLNTFCIQPTKSGGISVGNTYPTIHLGVRDEIGGEDSPAKRWNVDKEVSFSRFNRYMFTEQAREFMVKLSQSNVYRYVNNELLVDNDLAQKLSFVSVGDFDNMIRVIPTLGKDNQTGQIFEGITMFFKGMSTYVTLTHDEFAALISYLDHFDYDGFGLALLTTAIMSYGLEAVRNNDESVTVVSMDRIIGNTFPSTIPTL